MSTARTLVRFVFAGLIVNALAVACVVSDGDDNDDDNTACNPGDKKDCACKDGSDGEKVCSVSGNGYGVCGPCVGDNVGGSGGGGGEPSSTAGTTSTNYGGETSTPAGGAGGDAAGGTTSAAGAGGADSSDDLCVEDPADDCQTCVQVGCCAEWTACSEETEGDCQAEFFEIMACAQDERSTRDIKPEDLEACAAVQVDEGNAWSDGLLPSTKNLIDCVGGGQNWENRAWNTDSCNALCFLQE